MARFAVGFRLLDREQLPGRHLMSSPTELMTQRQTGHPFMASNKLKSKSNPNHA